MNRNTIAAYAAGTQTLIECVIPQIADIDELEKIKKLVDDRIETLQHEEEDAIEANP